MTDYYYPGLQVFEFSELQEHAPEKNAGFTKGRLSLSANYIVNQAGGAGSKGGDMYFQAGLAFTTSIFLLEPETDGILGRRICTVQCRIRDFKNYKAYRDILLNTG